MLTLALTVTLALTLALTLTLTRYAKANDPNNTWRVRRPGLKKHSSIAQRSGFAQRLGSAKFQFTKAEGSERGASGAHELPWAGIGSSEV